jgi:hypothetical protein
MITKPIHGHPQYSIDEYGNVKRTEGGRNRTEYVTQHKQLVKGKASGYLYTALLTCEKVIQSGESIPDYPCNKRIAVHRLVCIAFHGLPPDNKPWVNHKDGNKANNHYSNLEWTSISQNIQHAHDTGLIVRPTGPDHWNYGKKATKATKIKMAAKKIGENHPKFKGWYVVNGKKYASAREASEKTGIDQRKIRRMCHNKIDLCYFLAK